MLMNREVVPRHMNGTTVLNASDNAGIHDRHPQLHRWRFNLSTGAVVEELDDIALGVSVNEQRLGRPTGYGYTARLASGSMPCLMALSSLTFTGDSQIEFGRDVMGVRSICLVLMRLLRMTGGYLPSSTMRWKRHRISGGDGSRDDGRTRLA